MTNYEHYKAEDSHVTFEKLREIYNDMEIDLDFTFEQWLDQRYVEPTPQEVIDKRKADEAESDRLWNIAYSKNKALNWKDIIEKFGEAITAAKTAYTFDKEHNLVIGCDDTSYELKKAEETLYGLYKWWHD